MSVGILSIGLRNLRVVNKFLQHAQGILHRAKAPKSPHLFDRPRPRACGGSILEALLEERRNDR